jgi:hypothetical protein
MDFGVLVYNVHKKLLLRRLYGICIMSSFLTMTPFLLLAFTSIIT